MLASRDIQVNAHKCRKSRITHLGLVEKSLWVRVPLRAILDGTPLPGGSPQATCPNSPAQGLFPSNRNPWMWATKPVPEKSLPPMINYLCTYTPKTAKSGLGAAVK